MKQLTKEQINLVLTTFNMTLDSESINAFISKDNNAIMFEIYNDGFELSMSLPNYVEFEF